jgi:glutamate synthase (NADPH/NADH) small chain
VLDESGQKKMTPIEGSEISYSVDAVICTIENGPNPLIAATTPGLQMGEKGNISVDEAGRTSKNRVWAGGDVTTGSTTIILSMAAGRRAARSIHQFLCSY